MHSGYCEGSNGCNGSPPANPGSTTSYTISFDGVERVYIVHIPITYQNDQAIPMIFGLPGYTITAQYFSDYFGMNPHSDDNGYLAVYAQGTSFDTESVNVFLFAYYL